MQQIITSSQNQDVPKTGQVASEKKHSASLLLTIIATAFLGFAVIYIAGHAQADTLHDAAHDIRHGAGFPCH